MLMIINVNLFFFLLSGAFTTVLDLVVFAALLRCVEGSVAFIVSFSICVLVRFFFDSRISFQQRRWSIRSFSLYVFVNCSSMFFGLFLYEILSMSVGGFVGKILSIPPVTVVGFFLMRYFVFKNKPIENTRR